MDNNRFKHINGRNIKRSAHGSNLITIRSLKMCSRWPEDTFNSRIWWASSTFRTTPPSPCSSACTNTSRNLDERSGRPASGISLSTSILVWGSCYLKEDLSFIGWRGNGKNSLWTALECCDDVLGGYHLRKWRFTLIKKENRRKLEQK